MSHKRKCIICGEKYDYCPNCGNYLNLPRWMIEFCSENCRNIYGTCVDFGMGQLTKEEAYSRLKDADLSKKKDFTESTRNLIYMIFDGMSKTPAKVQPQKQNNYNRPHNKGKK